MGFLVVRGRPKGGQADWRVQTFAAVYHQAGEIPNRLGKRVAEARTFRHKDFSGILKEAGGSVSYTHLTLPLIHPPEPDPPKGIQNFCRTEYSF